MDLLCDVPSAAANSISCCSDNLFSLIAAIVSLMSTNDDDDDGCESDVDGCGSDDGGGSDVGSGTVDGSDISDESAQAVHRYTARCDNRLWPTRVSTMAFLKRRCAILYTVNFFPLERVGCSLHPHLRTCNECKRTGQRNNVVTRLVLIDL